MDYGVVGVSLLVLYLLLLSLPEAACIPMTGRHSLRCFLSGAG